MEVHRISQGQPSRKGEIVKGTKGTLNIFTPLTFGP